MVLFSFILQPYNVTNGYYLLKAKASAPTIEPLISEIIMIGKTKKLISGILNIYFKKKSCVILLINEPKTPMP